MMYIVCQKESCRQNYPVDYVSEITKGKNNARCEKCGEFLFNEDGVAELARFSPRERYLNFNIKLIEKLFGVKFEGKTLKDKEAFNAHYDELRKKEVEKILTDLDDEFMSQ